MEQENWTSFVKNIPACVMGICCGILMVFCISIVSTGFMMTLVSIPYYIVNGGEFWRLFTSLFVPLGLLELLICVPTFVSTGGQTEKAFGSVKYLLFFLCNCVLIQLLCVLLSFFFTSLRVVPIQAIYGEIMIEIIMISKKNPDSPVQFLCCPGKIKSAYYPYLFFLIFALLGTSKELLCGVLLSFLSNSYSGFKYSIKKISQTKIEFLENSLLCACISEFQNFIPISEALVDELPFIFIQNPSSQSPPNIRNDYEDFIDEDSL